MIDNTNVVFLKNRRTIVDSKIEIINIHKTKIDVTIGYKYNKYFHSCTFLWDFIKPGAEKILLSLGVDVDGNKI